MYDLPVQFELMIKCVNFIFIFYYRHRNAVSIFDNNNNNKFNLLTNIISIMSADNNRVLLNDIIINTRLIFLRMMKLMKKNQIDIEMIK